MKLRPGPLGELIDGLAAAVAGRDAASRAGAAGGVP